jgi:hypothetical protein
LYDLRGRLIMSGRREVVAGGGVYLTGDPGRPGKRIVMKSRPQ